MICVKRGFEGEVSQENQNKLVVQHIFHDIMDSAIKQLTLAGADPEKKLTVDNLKF